MPSMQELQQLRRLITMIQPTVNALTAPQNLKQMRAGTLYERPILQLPDCEVYVIFNDHTYALGLAMACNLGLDNKCYELMVAAWKYNGKIFTVPANIQQRHHTERHWNVRFFNLPVYAATAAYPQLEAF